MHMYMYMCMCMCMCMCVCMYKCMYMYTHTHTACISRTRIASHTDMCMHLYVYMYLYLCMYTHTHTHTAYLMLFFFLRSTSPTGTTGGHAPKKKQERTGKKIPRAWRHSHTEATGGTPKKQRGRKRKKYLVHEESLALGRQEATAIPVVLRPETKKKKCQQNVAKCQQNVKYHKKCHEKKKHPHVNKQSNENCSTPANKNASEKKNKSPRSTPLSHTRIDRPLWHCDLI